jgi:hypothetical protein
MNIVQRLLLGSALVALALAPVDRWILPQEVASAQGVPPLSGGKVPSDFDILVQGITARAGGGKANATLLTGTINEVTTVASAADSVLLPPCAAGAGPPKRIMVINGQATNAMQVFGSGTDTINGVATATGFSQPAMSATVAAGIEYTCASVASGVGRWYTQ